MSQENTVISPDNLPEIVKQVSKADQDGFKTFDQLYALYLDRIYRYVLYQVKDKKTAEDITEEVFAQAWKIIKACKGKGKTFSSLIYSIANNRIVNGRRNVRKFSDAEPEKINISDGNDSILETSTNQQELLDSIAELPENQAQVITLKFIEGYDNREISRILGKSEGAIRKSLLRGVIALRQKIGGGKYGT